MYRLLRSSTAALCDCTICRLFNARSVASLKRPACALHHKTAANHDRRSTRHMKESKVILSVDLQSIKDLPSRQRLRSWSSDTLAVPTSNLSTVGDRAFPITAARVWNTDVRSSSSQSTFKRLLKTELFSRSFPDCCDCVNFRYICKVASQIWLMPP